MGKIAFIFAFIFCFAQGYFLDSIFIDFYKFSYRTVVSFFYFIREKTGW